MLYRIAERLVAFVRDFDYDGYCDCLYQNSSKDDVVTKTAISLMSPDYFNSVCSFLTDIDEAKLDTELSSERKDILDMLDIYTLADKKKVAYTDYAVEINNDKGFVMQLETFDSYEAAENFADSYNEPLNSDEYLNIIFIDYNYNDDEIAFGTVC